MTQATKKVLGALLLLAVLSGCNRSPEARKNKFVSKGQEFLQKKEYPRAILEFKNAAQAVPKDPEVYYQLGIAYTGAGDMRSAAAAFYKTLGLDPKHVGARLKVAQMMTASGDPELLKDAETQLKELLAGSAPTPEMLNSLALTELQLGKPGDAVESLEEALGRAPRSLDYSITLARAKLLQNDVKGAEEALKKACDAAPNAADPREVLGQFYLSQKRLAEAEAEFHQALKIDPNHGQSLMDLAVLQVQSGRKSEAEQNFKRLAGMADKGRKPAYALFLFQEGRQDESIRELERLAQEDPEDRAARTRLVKAYQAAKRIPDAERVLGVALKKNSKDLDALLQRAELSVAARNYPQAETDLNQVLRLKPDSPELHYIYARYHQARGASRQYRQEMFESLRLNPFILPVRLELAQSLLVGNEAKAALDVLDDSPASQKQLTPVLMQRNWALWARGDMMAMRKGIDLGLARERSSGLLLQDGLWKLRQGNAAGARTALEEALKLNPADLRAMESLRQTYVALKQEPLALQKVKEFAAQQPKSAQAQEYLGTLLMASGQKDQARAAFLAAKTADPRYVRADLSLVQMAVADQNMDEARTKLQAIVAKGNSIRARQWLGNVELIKGNSAAAIEQFRQVLESEPDNADALNNMAFLLGEQPNRLDDALKYAQTARERAPKDPDIADTLGWICYRKGMYSLAVQHLEPAAAQSTNPVCKYHLAMAYAKLGNAERARTALEAARKANPNLPEAAEAGKLIASAK